MGGRVEQYSSWKTWITEAGVGDFTNSMLVRNAQIDFTKTTGITGPTSTHDEGYNKDTVVVEPLHCKGGDPTVSCQANFQQWGKTVDTSSPILLDYDLAPISDLVTDPNVKLALEAAIKDYYLEQQLVWENLNKCPVNCGPSGAGTCTWDGQTKQSSCQCTYSGMVGRQCTGCAPVTVKGTFTDIYGQDHSGVATVACNGQVKILVVICLFLLPFCFCFSHSMQLIYAAHRLTPFHLFIFSSFPSSLSSLFCFLFSFFPVRRGVEWVGQVHHVRQLAGSLPERGGGNGLLCAHFGRQPADETRAEAVHGSRRGFPW